MIQRDSFPFISNLKMKRRVRNAAWEDRKSTRWPWKSTAHGKAVCRAGEEDNPLPWDILILFNKIATVVYCAELLTRGKKTKT